MTRKKINSELTAVIYEFLETPENEKQEFVEKNKDVIVHLSTDSFLLELASEASYSEEAKINTFRKVLLDCNYRSVEIAFAEHEKLITKITTVLQEFIAVPRLNEKKQILKDNPDILTSLGIYVLNNIVTEAQRNALLTGTQKSARVKKVEQNVLLLMKCTEFGIDFPFWEIENNYDDNWVSQIETLGSQREEGNEMMDFFALIKSLVGQVKGLVIQEIEEDGFILRTDVEPVGRIFVSIATSDTVYFSIPEIGLLLFQGAHKIPKWLPDFLEERTKDKFSKWVLNDSGAGSKLYVLEYITKTSDLTPKSFEKICFSMMSESLSLKFWIMSLQNMYHKPLIDITPEPIDIQLGLPKKKGG